MDVIVYTERRFVFVCLFSRIEEFQKYLWVEWRRRERIFESRNLRIDIYILSNDFCLLPLQRVVNFIGGHQAELGRLNLLRLNGDLTYQDLIKVYLSSSKKPVLTVQQTFGDWIFSEKDKPVIIKTFDKIANID